MNKEDLNHVFKHKTWNEIKTKDSWQLFKIMSEFVNGFEKMSKIGPCVTIFGSARTDKNNQYYKLATKIGKELSTHGYGVITGGGPGIMEAGNKGAKMGSAPSVGLNIDLPFEAHSNKFIDNDKDINFDYFFVTILILATYWQRACDSNIWWLLNSMWKHYWEHALHTFTLEQYLNVHLVS